MFIFKYLCIYIFINKYFSKEDQHLFHRYASKLILFQNYDPYTCRYISLIKTGRLARVESPQYSTIYIQENTSLVTPLAVVEPPTAVA